MAEEDAGDGRKLFLSSSLDTHSDFRDVGQQLLWDISSGDFLPVDKEPMTARFSAVRVLYDDVQLFPTEILPDFERLPLLRDGGRNFNAVKVGTHTENPLDTADHHRGRRSRQPVHMGTSRV